ncbi:hypothetical protein QN277_013144 [Acacia crassicarpa]|uniref:CCHC-type domain-containing protein n=1 Tax=Acacia crassicarpa TaxID=499986 RepID=A0AAE1N2R5_9FABA|nr:hypothetical protein QN277_013144 [Acacia crassicarpa]
MADSKPTVTSELVSVSNKITDHKLNWTNYSDWIKTIRMHLLSIEKEGHLTKLPPKDDPNMTWARADARIFLQIQNSIEGDILPSICHCNTVKELIDYLEFLYSGKGNITRIHEVCKGFYRAEQQDLPLKNFFIEFNKMYEEMRRLMPPTTDLQAQINNMEKQAIMSFLTALNPRYETVRSQILSSSELPSLQDVYSRVLRADSLAHPAPNSNTSALAGRGPPNTQNQGSSRQRHGPPPVFAAPVPRIPGPQRPGNNPPSGIVCYYCKEPGHTKRYCRKLQQQQQRQRGSAHMAQSSEITDPTPSEPTALATGNFDSCLATSSSKWIIDSGATDHMTGSYDEADYW